MSECHELMMRYSRYFETTPHTHIFISIYPSYDALAGTFVCGLSKVDQHPGQGKRQWNGGRRWFQGFFIVLPDHSIWLLFQKGFATTCWLWKSRAVISAGVHFRSRDASRMMIYYNYLQSFLYNNMMYIYQNIYIYIHTYIERLVSDRFRIALFADVFEPAGCLPEDCQPMSTGQGPTDLSNKWEVYVIPSDFSDKFLSHNV